MVYELLFYKLDIKILAQDLERVKLPADPASDNQTNHEAGVMKTPDIIHVKKIHAKSAFVQVVIYSGLFFLLPSPFYKIYYFLCSSEMHP